MQTVSKLPTGSRYIQNQNQMQIGTTPLPPASGGRGLRSFKDYDEEARALAGDAYDLWRELAVKRANPYGDHSGCLLAGRMAVDASLWADGFVVLDAIRQRMDHKSSPRRIPEWAREAQADKSNEEHRARMAAEREMWDDIDPEARRVMVAVSRAKAQGERVSLTDVICVSCRQFTETKCPTCARPLHVRACPSQHECEAA